MNRHGTFSRILLSASVAAPLVLTLGITPSASAGCASGSSSIHGTIAGQDNRYVNAMLGFDILDRAGHRLGLDGCVLTTGLYGATLHVNYQVSAYGSATNPGGLTKNWQQKIPNNAYRVYIEVYPKHASSQPQFGVTDESHYSMAMRPRLVVPTSTSLTIKLPVLCHQWMGATGGIEGYTVTHYGVVAQASHVFGFSMAPDNNAANPILGMNPARTATNGAYYISNLSPNQQYTIVATLGGITKQVYQVYVKPCVFTRYDIHW